MIGITGPMLYNSSSYISTIFLKRIRADKKKLLQPVQRDHKSKNLQTTR
jgi:hypothetical protein